MLYPWLASPNVIQRRVRLVFQWRDRIITEQREKVNSSSIEIIVVVNDCMFHRLSLPRGFNVSLVCSLELSYPSNHYLPLGRFEIWLQNIHRRIEIDEKFSNKEGIVERSRRKSSRQIERFSKSIEKFEWTCQRDRVHDILLSKAEERRGKYSKLELWGWSK